MAEVRRSSAFLVLSNYNTDPAPYLKYCSDILVFDQSDDPAMAEAAQLSSARVIRSAHTGHNLSDYLSYFSMAWDDLPATVMLGKGNLIGRHVSAEYFERVRLNEHYTFLYQDATYRGVPGVSSLVYESGFLERNDSWYADTKPHRYFSHLNQLLDFLFVDPVHPEWILFSPGGCYIVPRANIVKNPPGLYEALRYISSYQFFPAEAYFVERLMHTVFTANYRVQPHILDFDHFREALEALPDRSGERRPPLSLREKAVRRLWPR